MSAKEALAGTAASGLSLLGRLDAFGTEFQMKFALPATLAIMHRVTDGLIASGQAQRALTAGDQAPDFDLLGSDRKTVSSRDLLAKGPIILTFFRGFWCPYCNSDLADLEMARLEIEKHGASLVAVSQQTAANNRISQRANNLGFPVLSDKGGALAHEFGIRWDVPDKLKLVHKDVGADLEALNGDDSWSLPMPARYVVDQDGIIAYSEVNLDYTQRSEPLNVFPVLKALRATKNA